MSLREVVIDLPVVLSLLARSDDLQRLRYLRLLGRLSEARTLATSLIESAAEPGGTDPWLLLIEAAEVFADSEDYQAADRLHASAWRQALTRARQASTLRSIGACHARSGELERAAAEFALAATMQRGFAEPDDLQDTESWLERLRARLDCDAIVLAGGRANRLGGQDKAGLKVAGWPLLDHALLAVSGARRRIVAGAPRRTLAEAIFCREEPAGSGPLAALDVAAQFVRQPTVAVLGVDLPLVGAALGSLRRALEQSAADNAVDDTVSEGGPGENGSAAPGSDGQADVAVLVDISGRTNYLASVWRSASLLSALGRLSVTDGTPIRRLYHGLRVVRVPDFDAYGADCDTWDEVSEASERLTRRNREQLAATPLAWPRLELYSPS